MMETRNLICINCPMGCSLSIKVEGDKFEVIGNLCKRGIDYAVSEITNPKRSITSSLFVNNGIHPTVSIKTSCEIPKGMIFDCMKELAGIRVDAPIKAGDVLIKNILNTGANIVATRNVEKRS